MTIDRQSVSLLVKVKAHEFLQQGRFHGRYEQYQKTVAKLLWEVEKLEREDKVKITGSRSTRKISKTI